MSGRVRKLERDRVVVLRSWRESGRVRKLERE